MHLLELRSAVLTDFISWQEVGLVAYSVDRFVPLSVGVRAPCVEEWSWFPQERCERALAESAYLFQDTGLLLPTLGLSRRL